MLNEPVTGTLPAELDDSLLGILGRPSFIAGLLARSLRALGREIPEKAEHEQAHVAFWLLGLYFKHGPDGWRQKAIAALEPAGRASIPKLPEVKSP